MTLQQAQEAACDECGLLELHCSSCGVAFGLSSELYYFRRCDGKSFHCPNGHGNIFTGGVSDAELKLARQLEQVETELAESKGSKLKISKLLGKNR